MTMIKRKKTRVVSVGGVKIGGNSPVSIQSMAKTDTSDHKATIREILALEKAGCEIVRVAVKDMEDARAISRIRPRISIPLVADIHFDRKLAVEAVKSGADKIRINPGNISKKEDISEVIDACAAKKIPIRIGVNSGSLMDVKKGKALSDKAMVERVLRYLEHFEKKDFHDIVISIKSSDVVTTVNAYREMSTRCDYPLHVGVTAAGLPADGIVRSSIGIGALLMEGIGDTIRVSLTGDPAEEVYTAKRILSSLGLRNFGPEIISCPTCGRCQVDLVSVVEELEAALQALSVKRQAVSGKGTKNEQRTTNNDIRCTIAIMGCEVNGPGEAKCADIGIAFGKGRAAVFRRGKIVKVVARKDAVRALLELM